MLNNNSNASNQALNLLSGTVNPQAISKTPDICTILMTLKLQNLQSEIYKNQLMQLIGARNNIIQGALMKVNQPTPFLLPQQAPVIQRPAQMYSSYPTQTTLNQCLRLQIREVVEFLVENYGKLSEKEIENEKYKHTNNKNIVEMFEILVSKYATTLKTKEEMIKYTLRKAFKFIKNNLKSEHNLDSKTASTSLCKRYFSTSHVNFAEIENKIDDEEEFIKLMLPFRKNSKNKTMNNNFISEIFSSDQFCQDYQKYLDNFDSILDSDNSNKINKLITFVEECISKDNIKELKKYKRIPWLKIWNENTKKLAETLLEEKYIPSLRKKVKANTIQSGQEEKQIKVEDDKTNN